MPTGLLEHLGPADNALDLGTGGGRLAGALLETCRRVSGIDRSPELLRQAELEHPDVRFLLGDILDPDAWDRAGAPFDLVVSNCAVRRDHTPDLDRLAEICREKAPDARMALRLQARDDMREILPGTVRELFFSKTELEKAFPGALVLEESYRQRFSSGHFRRFLERIDINWSSDFQGSATRRNLILVRSRDERN
jgi:SAM-dependent methyltransferase